MSISFPNHRREHPFRASSNQTASSLAGRQKKLACLVDVPDCVCDALFELAPLFGIELRSFDSLSDYLEHNPEEYTACLILDLQTRGCEELACQCRLARESSPPTIFVCRHCDISAAVCAIKSGAIEVLTLPLDPADLFDAVKSALVVDQKRRQRSAECAELQRRYSLLTPREREVLPLIVSGLLNKQAAWILGISEVTLQIHRSQVMRKMQADSVAHLVRMAATLDIPAWAEAPPDTSPATSSPASQQFGFAAALQRVAK